MSKTKFMVLAFIVLLTTCTMALTACGDDKDEPTTNTLVGQWELQNVAEVYPHVESRIVWEFKSDGNMIQYYFYDSFQKWVEDDPRPYSFTPSGNGENGTLILDLENMTENDKLTYKFTDDGLIITFIYLLENASIDFKFKRTSGIRAM